METLIIHSEGKKIRAIQAFLEAFGVDFEIKKEDDGTYDPDFVAKKRESEEDLKAGRVRKVTLDEIWK